MLAVRSFLGVDYLKVKVREFLYENSAVVAYALI
jgi:hypothetical protein